MFKRKDDESLIYLPKDLAENTMLLYNGEDSVFGKASFKEGGD